MSMKKRGLSEVVTVVLLILLLFVAVVSIWNIFIYFSDKADRAERGLLKGLFSNETVSLCEANWQCNQWSNCELAYNLNSLAGEIVLLNGQKYRECEDLSHCKANKLDEDNCKTEKDIGAKKVLIDGQWYIEIYDKEKNLLIARIKESEIDNFKKLNIEFFA